MSITTGSPSTQPSATAEGGDMTKTPETGTTTFIPLRSAAGSPMVHRANPPAVSQPRFTALMLLTVLLLTVFLAVANIFIVNVATPAIQQGLHASFSDVQFVMTSYTLAYAMTLIIGGRLGDRFGRKRLLLFGVAGFTLSSFLCGIAGSVITLMVFRVLQGISAALMMPQVLSLIQTNYPPEKRAGVFGLYGAAQGIAASSGQLIGGLLLSWDPAGLDWRTVFFFSVPVGLLILSMIPYIEESKGSSAMKLDWLGAAWAAGGLLMLIYPLVQGQKEQWPVSLIACLLLSVPVLAAFVWYERRVARLGGAPLMNVDLFRQRRFTVGMLIVVVLMSSQSAYFLVSAYFLQIGLGFTALAAGLIILPMGIGYFLASLYSARAVSRFGQHVLTVGALLTCGGYLLLAQWVQALGTSVQGYEWAPALAVLGFGQGALAAPLTAAILSRVHQRDAGSASGILTTGMQVSFAVGIALIGILLLNIMGQHANATTAQLAPQLQTELSKLGISGAQSDVIVQEFQACYADYARAGDPAANPASCSALTADAQIKPLIHSLMKQAHASNYAYTFSFCLYVLAAFSLLLVPLVLGLIREKRTDSQVLAS
ncbi:MFS transporter [Brevibacillus ruminantium]|uniref:MFS transporter n=1 Tax=Brevibacillus ruminantium TaxID=2950604 RepID=A0ABY4WGD4_9BACL|nr:MFS transporter [Brevibacillus ruminantium]USG66142.1 MFS transporter [Brevibacillus ruminantium]